MRVQVIGVKKFKVTWLSLAALLVWVGRGGGSEEVTVSLVVHFKHWFYTDVLLVPQLLSLAAVQSNILLVQWCYEGRTNDGLVGIDGNLQSSSTHVLS